MSTKIPADIIALAHIRRDNRWAKEREQRAEAASQAQMIQAIAKWKNVSPQQIKLSNVFCSKAPADLSCVYVSSANPYTNPCIFCGGPEHDIM